jgi:hypothetical protein
MDSTTSADGGGGTCPDSTAFTATTYVSATKHQGKCTSAQTTAFETACGDAGTVTTCSAWQTANVATDAGAGTACGNCILNPNNAGAAWSDPNGEFGPNYAGCIQLTDPKNGGPACAPALDNLDACEGLECDDCADSATYQTCATAVDGAICSSYLSTAQTACATDFADGGAATTCQPGGGTTANPDWTFIITLICGT